MFVVAGSAAAQAPRELIASGDTVPGFGQIGRSDLYVQGIDGRGRVLVVGGLDTGERAALWADDDGPELIWRSRQTPRLLQGFAFSPGGRVAAFEIERTEGEIGSRTVAVVEGVSPFRRVVAIGDRTPEGLELCDFLPPLSINDAGAVAFAAMVAAPGECPDFDHTAIYVADGGPLRLQVEESSSLEEMLLVELLPDGEVVYISTPDIGDAPEQAIIARDGARRCPAGELPDCPVFDDVLGASSAGEVLYWDGSAGGRVVRSDAGTLRDVVAAGDRLANGFVVSNVSNYGGALNAAGDTALIIRWNDGGVPGEGSVVLAADGAVQTLPTNPAGLNDAGQVALRLDGAAARWDDGDVATLFAADEEAPGGGVFFTEGLFGSVCLGEDGQVGLVAENQLGEQGLLCIDGAGVHLLAKAGDATADRPLRNFYACGFGDRELFSVATTGVHGELGRTSLFRATVDGLDRLIGPDTVSEDGPIFADVSLLSSIAANRRGEAVVQMAGDGDGALYRSDRAARVVQIDLDPNPARSAAALRGFGLTEDGTVLAAARIDGIWSLVAGNGEAARILLTADDPRFSGGPHGEIKQLLAAGRGAVFSVGDRQRNGGVYRYDLGAESLRQLLPDDPDPFFPRQLIDLTPGGRLLFEEAAPDPSEELWPTASFILDGDRIEEVFRRSALSDSAPQAINDRGNILWRATSSRLGAAPHSLSLSGRPAIGRCPVPQASSGNDDDGCQVGPPASHAGWLMLPPLFLLLRRRVGRQRAGDV